MKLSLTQLLMAIGLWSSYATASPVATSVDTKVTKRDAACSNPGEYMCGLIIAVAMLQFPFPGQVATLNRWVEIVNGNCDSILASDGTLTGDGNGFDSVYQTTYNTQLQLWADYVAMDDFRNVNFLYNNQDWHYQYECTQGDNGLDPAYSTLQCNFPC
ncbi:hypothetical protein SEPCBS57363_002364 [Sporothrix epigloea]|uniref:Uncharacterized protein n=1 Tax=Sporothrix epigloea TaxID=1892477 RepID=A0ABP0DJJ4_9PEZI